MAIEMTLTNADIEIIRKIGAMLNASAPVDVTGAVAADVAPAVPQTVETASNVKTVTGCVTTTGKYGIVLDGAVKADGTPAWTTVGAKNRESTGPIFAGIEKGSTVEITLDGKRAKSVRVLIGATQKESAARQESVKATVEAAPISTRVAAATANACTLCDGPKHPHEGTADLVCAARQYARLTGQNVSYALGNGPAFVQFAQWLAASPRTVYAANKDGQKQIGGSIAPAAPAPAAPAPAAPAPAAPAPATTTRRPMHPCAGADGKLRTTAADGKCKACREITQEDASASSAPAVDTALVAAMSVPTVAELAPAEKTPAQLANNELPTDGVFVVQIYQFKKLDQPNPEQPIISLVSERFVTSQGKGRWLRCRDTDVYSKLTAMPVGTWVRIKLVGGLIANVTRNLGKSADGSKIATPPIIDEAGIKTSGKNLPAEPTRKPVESRSETRRAARGAVKAARGQTIYSCSQTSTHRTTCGGKCIG